MSIFVLLSLKILLHESKEEIQEPDRVEEGKVIQKYESGIKLVEICRMYRKSPSPIIFILAKRETLKETKEVKEVNVLTKKRLQTT